MKIFVLVALYNPWVLPIWFLFVIMLALTFLSSVVIVVAVYRQMPEWESGCAEY
ncbi:hypothetical protein [Pectobacterium brasiliense]|uniref:hypothetical protein n=1 Tax=Pectobacterium brasiliense TaxID=180957 RepID=UPI0032EFFC1B